LQEVLSELLGEEVSVEGASRTDAGVHARDQLAAFSLRHPMRLEGIVKGLNRRLPLDIAVREPVEVPLDFQPRFANQGKRYIYRVFTSSTPDPLRGRFATRLHYELDPGRVSAAMLALLGTHDFKSFAAANGQHKHSVRRLDKLSIERAPDDLWALTFEGPGFLKQMVRNLVGTLLEVGRGHWEVERVAEALKALDRRAGGPTAPAQGLTLEQMFWSPDTLSAPTLDD
jgi:tRNA pseudouridine38-40 synthase